MRTLILSDLHLGNGGPYDIFAGAAELPALFDSFTRTPTHVVLNGDSFDFLLNDDPLAVDPQRTLEQARALVTSAPTAPALKALGRVLAAGGRATMVVGNHDLELALPDVQEVIRSALGQPREVASRLEFRDGTAPLQLEVGGSRVLVTHGEHTDVANRIDYDSLLSSERANRFRYPPGSVLVKTLLNPLKHQHRMRYMDLLKPDFEGAVMVALGVKPDALKVLFNAGTLTLIRRLLENRGLAPAFALEPMDMVGGSPADVHLARSLARVDLKDDEVDALLSVLDPETLNAFDNPEALGRARLKLAKAGFALYARLHRAVAGKTGTDYFALEPGKDELAETARLGKKYSPQAVVMGHTHAARWHEGNGPLYANTGTWISLLRLPAPEASDEEWGEYLAELQGNPSLDPAKQKHAKLEQRFTFVEVEPHASARGATLRLSQWTDQGPKTLRSAELPAGS
ncbi:MULTISPECIES: metallophosphoesterase [unclassified Corallococcus]|uniref:metallophosphoesterase n=1 Tax=unclassified Corallococcus TaxID=2685029 RepID=UPI001A8CF710|nr:MULTISPECIES: metallophosphoesterase [unclassified Corallococcus]MBN9685179.1 metallophosphoesterase family protein [Corallococcus sp. NCSPR001]WAS83362.1 metallophosphoesterase [Corallococcus sp. NCRR]